MGDMLQALRQQAEYRRFADASAMRPWVGPILLTVAVGVAYFFAARLSLLLLTKPDGVAVFWPASGIAAGVLITLGPGARWPVATAAIVATIAANLLGDRNLPSVIVFGVCNAGEALLTAWLIEWRFGPRFELDRLSHALGLVVASAVATTVSGLGGTLGYVLFHSSPASALTIWRHWFASDALGIITVAPLLIGLRSTLRNPPPKTELIEGIGALSALTAVSTVAVFSRELWSIAAPALLFPLLLWLTARCRPVFASAAAFIAAFAIVWSATFEIGYYGDLSVPPSDRILAAQATILGVSLCAFVLAALFSERRQHEATLTESEGRLQQALAVGRVAAFDWDVLSDVLQSSESTAQVLGFDQRETVTGTWFLERVHPDDRAHFKELMSRFRPDNPSLSAVFRFIRPDGREAWLHEISKAEFDADGRLIRLKGLLRDITERKRNEEHQNVLMAELDHRVKNVLARVAMLAASTRKGSTSIDEYVGALNGRIQSMAAAHGLLSQSGWQNVGLGAVVRKQLAPYATGANVTITGDDITLSATEMQSVAMVLHELVTNAAKYGSLSIPNGRVGVTWNRQKLNGATKLVLEWRESGGPPVAAYVPPGYGTSLIRNLIPHELGGAVDLVFAPDGVSCKIEIEQMSPSGPHGSETSLSSALRL